MGLLQLFRGEEDSDLGGGITVSCHGLCDDQGWQV